jgi:hypothetical protein
MVAQSLAQSLELCSYTLYVYYVLYSQATRLTQSAGILRLLWFPGLPPHPREPSWRDKSVMSKTSRRLGSDRVRLYKQEGYEADVLA